MLLDWKKAYPFSFPSLIYARTSTDKFPGLKTPENFSYRNRQLTAPEVSHQPAVSLSSLLHPGS